MKNLLTIKYWFSVNPGSLNSSGLNLLIIIIALLFLISIVSIILKRKRSLYRGAFNSIYNFSIANFIIGLLFLFFHYENIPFFTARFWLAIWAIGLVVWLAFIGKKIKKIPEKRKEIEKEQEKKKYLP
jgi:glucan phosphoethanolaminetransferase (alkaline phosphatase superfamily)